MRDGTKFSFSSDAASGSIRAAAGGAIRAALFTAMLAGCAAETEPELTVEERQSPIFLGACPADFEELSLFHYFKTALPQLNFDYQELVRRCGDDGAEDLADRVCEELETGEAVVVQGSLEGPEFPDFANSDENKNILKALLMCEGRQLRDHIIFHDIRSVAPTTPARRASTHRILVAGLRSSQHTFEANDSNQVNRWWYGQPVRVSSAQIDVQYARIGGALRTVATHNAVCDGRPHWFRYSGGGSVGGLDPAPHISPTSYTLQYVCTNEDQDPIAQLTDPWDLAFAAACVIGSGRRNQRADDDDCSLLSVDYVVRPTSGSWSATVSDGSLAEVRSRGEAQLLSSLAVRLGGSDRLCGPISYRVRSRGGQWGDWEEDYAAASTNADSPFGAIRIHLNEDCQHLWRLRYRVHVKPPSTAFNTHPSYWTDWGAGDEIVGMEPHEQSVMASPSGIDGIQIIVEPR